MLSNVAHPVSFRCVCLLALSILVHVGFAASKGQKAIYDREVFIGADTAKFGDTCIASSALMSAGDFFTKLKVTGDEKELRFWKGSKRVDKFPSEISVEVRMVIVECAQPGDTRANLTSEFMHAVRVEAQWKTGMQMRPVKDLSVEVALKPEGDFWDRWLYIITVRDPGVPLTDHLVVTMLSKKGGKIARFSGHL